MMPRRNLLDRRAIVHALPKRAAWRRMALVWPLCLLLLAGQAGAVQAASEEASPDLLTGYGLLETSLSGEGMLKWLLLVRKVTFNAPAKATQDLLSRISQAAAKRAEELGELRKLPPSTLAAGPASAIGDAIQTAATEAGTHEMIFPDGAFDIRFLFLQAQATRMISVIAEQTAKIDPNKERKAWLEAVGKQFVDFRDQLVGSLSACIPKE